MRQRKSRGAACPGASTRGCPSCWSPRALQTTSGPCPLVARSPDMRGNAQSPGESGKPGQRPSPGPCGAGLPTPTPSKAAHLWLVRVGLRVGRGGAGREGAWRVGRSPGASQGPAGRRGRRGSRARSLLLPKEGPVLVTPARLAGCVAPCHRRGTQQGHRGCTEGLQSSRLQPEPSGRALRAADPALCPVSRHRLPATGRLRTLCGGGGPAPAVTWPSPHARPAVRRRVARARRRKLGPGAQPAESRREGAGLCLHPEAHEPQLLPLHPECRACSQALLLRSGGGKVAGRPDGV